jgi:hypothetical protein
MTVGQNSSYYLHLFRFAGISMINARNAFYAAGTILFFVFMTLQFNDVTQYGNSDAWTWVLIYGAMMAINAGQIFCIIPREWLFAWSGFGWGALFFRIQDEQGNVHFDWLHPDNYWDPTGTTMIQNSNESGGLLILAVWATALVFLEKKL